MEAKKSTLNIITMNGNKKACKKHDMAATRAKWKLIKNIREHAIYKKYYI